MAATGVQFTDMHLSNSIRKCMHDVPQQHQRRVQLPGVGDIQAESGLGQLFEQILQLVAGAPDGFTSVHVFDQKMLAENRPQAGSINHIWVNDDVPALLLDRLQSPGFPCFSQKSSVHGRIRIGSSSVEDGSDFPPMAAIPQSAVRTVQPRGCGAQSSTKRLSGSFHAPRHRWRIPLDGYFC